MTKNFFHFALTIFVFSNLSLPNAYGGQGQTYDPLTNTDEIIGNKVKLILTQIESALESEFLKSSFNAITKLHNEILTKDKFGSSQTPQYYSDFENDPSSLVCHRPDYCFYGNNSHSYAGKFAEFFCGHELSDDRECCFCLSCAPCGLIQALTGCFLPCGYDNGCCITYQSEAIEFNTEGAKGYLKSLQRIYQNDHWQNYQK